MPAMNITMAAHSAGHTGAVALCRVINEAACRCHETSTLVSRLHSFHGDVQ